MQHLQKTGGGSEALTYNLELRTYHSMKPRPECPLANRRRDNSFICHTCEKTPANSNHCHRSKITLPQVLCLPHVQDTPSQAPSQTSSRKTLAPSQFGTLPLHLPWCSASATGGCGGFFSILSALNCGLQTSASSTFVLRIVRSTVRRFFAVPSA